VGDVCGNTNILYITSDCNIACEYCYQREDRKKNNTIKASHKQIDDFLLNLVDIEPNVVSSVVVFGGEPFLESESVFYLYDKASHITAETGKRYNFCTNTNGIWFINTNNREKFFQEVKKVQNSGNNVSLELSYDGDGHTRRNYKNGKNTQEDIKGVLRAFKEANFPFHLRYTVHKGTLGTFKSDMVKLSKFLTYHNNNRIVLSFYRSEIEPLLTKLYDKYIQELTEFSRGVFLKYQIPICELVCMDCKKCNFNIDKVNQYTIPTGDDVVSFGTQEAGDFDHFTKKD